MSIIHHTYRILNHCLRDLTGEAFPNSPLGGGVGGASSLKKNHIKAILEWTKLMMLTKQIINHISEFYLPHLPSPHPRYFGHVRPGRESGSQAV